MSNACIKYGIRGASAKICQEGLAIIVITLRKSYSDELGLKDILNLGFKSAQAQLIMCATYSRIRLNVPA
jgi:hypothetical protein